MRFTFPALITSAIKLCRRCKNQEHVVSSPFGYQRLIQTGSTGRGLEDQSVHNDQVHPTVDFYPGHASGCPDDCVATIPTGCTNRG